MIYYSYCPYCREICQWGKNVCVGCSATITYEKPAIITPLIIGFLVFAPGLLFLLILATFLINTLLLVAFKLQLPQEYLNASNCIITWLLGFILGILFVGEKQKKAKFVKVFMTGKRVLFSQFYK